MCALIRNTVGLIKKCVLYVMIAPSHCHNQTHNTLTTCIKFNFMIILLLADIYTFLASKHGM